VDPIRRSLTLAFSANEAPLYLQEARQLFALSMVVLSFPSGFVWVTMLAQISALSQFHQYSELGSVWIGCIAIGYVQWFIFIPSAIFRLVKKSPSTESPQ